MSVDFKFFTNGKPLYVAEVVGANKRADPKVCKKLLSWKQPGQLFYDPKPLTGSLRCTCVYIAAGRLDYCMQEAIESG